MIIRDIFNAISKSATSLPEIGTGMRGNERNDENQPHTADGTSFPVGNTKKKSKKSKKVPTVVNNPKRYSKASILFDSLYNSIFVIAKAIVNAIIVNVIVIYKQG